METLLAFVVGGLVAAGVYLILSRNLVRLIIGVALLSNAVNLTLFTAGRLTRANPPLIPTGAEVPESPFANPLPQALILTAIVIGFGLLAFTLVLIYRANQELGTVDPDEMRLAEPPYETALGRGSAPRQPDDPNKGQGPADRDPVKQGVSG